MANSGSWPARRVRRRTPSKRSGCSRKHWVEMAGHGSSIGGGPPQAVRSGAPRGGTDSAGRSLSADWDRGILASDGVPVNEGEAGEGNGRSPPQPPLPSPGGSQGAATPRAAGAEEEPGGVRLSPGPEAGSQSPGGMPGAGERRGVCAPVFPTFPSRSFVIHVPPGGLDRLWPEP